MAIALDAVSTPQIATTTTTLTISHTCTGTNLCLFASATFDTGGAGTVSSATYNSVAMTFVDDQEDGDSGGKTALYYLKNPATGTHDIVFTFSSAYNCTGAGVSFTGVDQTTPVGASNKASGTAATASVTITTASGEVIIAALGSNAGDSRPYSAGANETFQWQTSNDVIQSGGALTQNGVDGGSISPSISGARGWAIIGISIKPAIVAAVKIPRTFQQAIKRRAVF